MYVACREGHVEVVKILLTSGADVAHYKADVSKKYPNNDGGVDVV